MIDVKRLTRTEIIEPAAPSRQGRIPRWLLFWRSPEDQPAWARPALLAIAILAAILYAWNIRVSGYSLYYSIAVKSMSVSWKALLFGALDPGATITIDKLAGAFQVQALFARIFGFHQWSVTLPQVIAGVVSVLVMYRLTRRWFGVPAGMLAAGLFALTPIIASMFGHPMEDGLLVMCLVLATDAFVRALADARLRWLVLAGVWVGLGFQAKMLQAWMILPALFFTYLIVAPTDLRRRLGHLTVAGAVMVAVSMSWILLYSLTPPQHRPYVDGSTNNSAFAMVFGYNGLSRFGIHVPGSVQTAVTVGGQAPAGSAPVGSAPVGSAPGGSAPGGSAPAAQPAGGGGSSGSSSNQGWTKLISPRYASQIGWLYPLALVGLVAGLVRYRRAGRTDLARGGFVLWGLWLATFATIFSGTTIPHTAYMASLAPPLAGLTAAGIVLLWRAQRDRSAAWLLPLVIAAEVAWTAYLARQYATFLPWLTWLVVAAGAVSAIVLAAAVIVPRIPRRALVPVMALGTAAMVAVPSAWAASVLHTRYGGTAFDASAGPARQAGVAIGPAGAGQSPGASGTGTNSGGQSGPVVGPGSSRDTLTMAEQQLYNYLVSHRDGAKFVAATSGWNGVGPYIMATGQPFLPMGGFTSSVPQPTLAAAQSMVATGQLRYFLLGGPGGRRGGTELSRILAWVEATCTAVPPSEYGGAGQQQQALYRCGS